MTHKIRVYPHNDLFNLAHYQREVINQKVEEGNEDAIDLDCLACLVSIAFSIEAIINFVGHKKISDWKERQPYKNKIVKVLEKVSLEFDKNKEPYSTVWQLKELRDSIAHGVPVEKQASISSKEELRQAMECPWDSHLSPEYVNHAYTVAKDFEHMLFEAWGITVGESVTSALSGRT